MCGKSTLHECHNVNRCLYSQKHDFEVAVKCIKKKNLAKSQTLLGKEIRILKVSFLITLWVRLCTHNCACYSLNIVYLIECNAFVYLLNILRCMVNIAKLDLLSERLLHGPNNV